uniref:Dimethylglycine dehydrogenase,mitochondrial n=1 Tax=Hydra vulgaris TaxID=6087 RepID=T2M409_HYDVU
MAMLSCHNNKLSHIFHKLHLRNWSTTILSLSEQKSSNKQKIKENVEVAVIGGGVVGTSILYHLAKQGVKDVVLLEKTELTAGSTWHAAGLVTAYHPTPNLKYLHWYSVNLYAQLEKETGQAVGFHRPGSLRLITTKGRLEEAQYTLSRQRVHDAHMWLINPDEVHKSAPYMNMDGVLGGLFTPGDGHIDPYSLTQALAIGARKNGGEIYLNTPVTNLRQNTNGFWNIETPNGVIKAKKIVNAAGFWGREIGKMVGIEHPLIPIHHQYVVTNTIPEVAELKFEIPVFRDLENSYYLRQEKNGLLIGPYESAKVMKVQSDWWDGVTPGFGKELFSSDLERIMPHLQASMERFPCIATADIVSVVAGPITYTPDILPMVGPFPEIQNYWCALGFGYGIVHAGGVGKFLADWIQSDEPPKELSELDPGRYGKWTTKEYVLEKARESYGLNTLQYYPKEERTGGRPMRVSPLYEILKENGAQYTFSSGWEVPKWYAQKGDDTSYKPSYYRTNWFEPVRREVQNVLNNVSIADISAFAKFHITGKDASKFLNYMVANKLPSIGRTNVSHMLSSTGKVYAEVTVSALAPNHYLVITGGGSEYHDLRWLIDHARKYDVQIDNKTDQVSAISINGPRSRVLLQKLTSTDVSDKAFSFMQNKELDIGGIPVLALRVSYTGELGWEFYVENSKALDLYIKLLTAGQELNIDHVGAYAINSMRIEKGFRLWGSEMNMDVGPYEAGLDFFIKLDKGDFLGRDALISHKRTIQKKRLVCMIVQTDNIDPEGDQAIWLGDEVIGNTTSGCYGYTVEKSIAYGYLPYYISEPGNEVYIEMLGKKYPATVVTEPLVQMEAARARKAKVSIADTAMVFI